MRLRRRDGNSADVRSCRRRLRLASIERTTAEADTCAPADGPAADTVTAAIIELPPESGETWRKAGRGHTKNCRLYWVQVGAAPIQLRRSTCCCLTAIRRSARRHRNRSRTPSAELR